MPELTASQLSGYFGMDLLPTRRNSKTIDMTDTRQLQRIHSLCARRAGLLQKPQNVKECLLQIKGVVLNGHAIKQVPFIVNIC